MGLLTSNNNESIHASVWKRAPKSKYCGRKTIEIPALAFMQFNGGAEALLKVVDSLGVVPGETLAKVTSRLDVTRLRKADKAAHNESKTIKKRVTMKLEEECKKTVEEGHLYKAGAY